MKRSDVWWVNFDPSIGGEIKKMRPAVIVSNDSSNRYINRVQVVPITGNTERLYPSEAYVRFNGKDGKAMADQITTISKLRMIKKAGHIKEFEMKDIEKAIRIQLELK